MAESSDNVRRLYSIVNEASWNCHAFEGDPFQGGSGRKKSIECAIIERTGFDDDVDVDEVNTCSEYAQVPFIPSVSPEGFHPTTNSVKIPDQSTQISVTLYSSQEGPSGLRAKLGCIDEWAIVQMRASDWEKSFRNEAEARECSLCESCSATDSISLSTLHCMKEREN